MNFLLLIKDGGRAARVLGTQLMELGHTVFLADPDADIDDFAGLLDGVVVMQLDRERPEAARAVLLQPADRSARGFRELRARAVLSLPTTAPADLTSFTSTLTH